jgi:hypothetical protein
MARAGVRAGCDDGVKDTAPDSAMGGRKRWLSFSLSTRCWPWTTARSRGFSFVADTQLPPGRSRCSTTCAQRRVELQLCLAAEARPISIRQGSGDRRLVHIESNVHDVHPSGPSPIIEALCWHPSNPAWRETGRPGARSRRTSDDLTKRAHRLSRTHGPKEIFSPARNHCGGAAFLGRGPFHWWLGVFGAFPKSMCSPNWLGPRVRR